MKMKKLLSLVLASALVLALAACGNSGSNSSSAGNSSAGSTASGDKNQTELEYPVRSINNIIPFGAGGGTDVWNRALMDSMGSIMNQTVVSSNMTGGSAGSIGVQYVWDAAHDGYTLCGTSETPLTIPVMTNSELTSKDWKFFIAAGSPGVLCINKNAGMTTLEEVVAATEDGSVSIAGTTGGLWFALAKLFDSYGNVPFKWIAYDGSATAIKGCVSNEADLVVASAGEVVEYVRSGDLIPLCVMNTQEWEFPDYGSIPAVTTVVPELEAYLPLSQFLGFMVPADTDAAVVTCLEEVFHKAMKSDKIQQFAKEQVCQIYDMTGEEASEFAAQLESKLCWVLYDMGQTTYSPEDCGIPQPGV